MKANPNPNPNPNPNVCGLRGEPRDVRMQARVVRVQPRIVLEQPRVLRLHAAVLGVQRVQLTQHVDRRWAGAAHRHTVYGELLLLLLLLLVPWRRGLEEALPAKRHARQHRWVDPAIDAAQ